MLCSLATRWCRDPLKEVCSQRAMWSLDYVVFIIDFPQVSASLHGIMLAALDYGARVFEDQGLVLDIPR